MEPEPLFVRADDLLADIAENVKGVDYRAAVVVDGRRRPVGMVTRSDRHELGEDAAATLPDDPVGRPIRSVNSIRRRTRRSTEAGAVDVKTDLRRACPAVPGAQPSLEQRERRVPAEIPGRASREGGGRPRRPRPDTRGGASARQTRAHGRCAAKSISTAEAPTHSGASSVSAVWALLRALRRLVSSSVTPRIPRHAGARALAGAA